MDTTAPTVAFDPADGGHVRDTGTDITLTFSEPVRKDAAGTELADGDLAGILTLKTGSASGTAIGFTASIDAAKKVITIDPTSALAAGDVHVAVTNAWFDRAGNRGAAADATFTVDTTAPTVAFSPANGGHVKDTGTDITLTFSEPVRKDAAGTELADGDLAGILTLKTGSASGTAIGFTASIDAAKKVITIDPSSDLAAGDVHVAVTNAWFDRAGNQGAAADATFTVDTTAPTVAFDPAAGGHVRDTGTDITLTFSEPVRKDAAGTELADGDLAGILTLKTGSASGTAIGFTASIDAAKKVITIDPTSALAAGDVHVAVTNAWFDRAGNRGAAAEATFTVDTTAPTVAFDPAAGGHVRDTGTDITLIFSEPVRKDAAGTELADGDLAGILTLKTGSASGTAIGFTASIDAAKKVITIDPTSALAAGDVHVAVTNAWFDRAGNRGAAAEATFTVDTTAPTVAFDPAAGGHVRDTGTDITLTFSEPVRKDAAGTELADGDLDAILTLKTGSASGTAIGFTASIDAAKKVITIDPTSALAAGDVHVAVTNAWFDRAGNQGAAAEATFTVDTTAPTVAFDPANGRTANDAATNITLTFSEPVRKDAAGTELANDDLAGILTLKRPDARGFDLTFTASIDAAKKVITIDPAADLADGDVHVAVTNVWFDRAGNQGAAADATFTVDTTAPTVAFDPAAGGHVRDTGTDITLTFSEPVRKDAAGTELADGDLDAILTLKTGSASGTAIGFTASIDAAKKVITIDPAADLADGPVHVAVTNVWFDRAGNQGRRRMPPSPWTPPRRRWRSTRPTAGM